MMTEQKNRPHTSRAIDTTALETTTSIISRYGLALVIGWIGILKFTEYEAQGIQPLVANSPFMSWLYDFLPVGTFSALLGVFEVAAAVLIAVKPLAPRVSIAGSLMAVLLFVATISFLFTTPGVGEPAGGGFPALSSTGQFLLKDIPLLGLSLWTVVDALKASRNRTR